MMAERDSDRPAGAAIKDDVQRLGDRLRSAFPIETTVEFRDLIVTIDRASGRVTRRKPELPDE